MKVVVKCVKGMLIKHVKEVMVKCVKGMLIKHVKEVMMIREKAM